MVTDWVGWHEGYADPGSSLSRRRAVVQRELRTALDGLDGPIRLISMCAGDGGDVLPVLGGHPAGARTDALLVELNPELARRAGTTPRDAGLSDSYLGHGRAHILLACGVFGNMTLEDAHRTIAAIPGLTEPGATVIWTRATGESHKIRALFKNHEIPYASERAQKRESKQEQENAYAPERAHDGGPDYARAFRELSFIEPDDAPFRVGVHRVTAIAPPPAAGTRLFRFRAEHG